MGNAFPQPGLYSKFYDLDMDVLVEVIRDTVGRHDSFLLACTSRYYENLGYFGHTNCTDNFNRQLETYAIAPQEGLAGAQLLLQHDVRDRQPPGLRRAVVPPGRLRAAARGDRSRLRLQRLPRRRRPRERLGPDRGARARLLPRAHVLRGDRAPRDARCRTDAHDGDRLPSTDLGAHEPDHASTTATGCRRASTTTARPTSTGRAASGPRSWTSRRSGSSRCSGPTPRR